MDICDQNNLFRIFAIFLLIAIFIYFFNNDNIDYFTDIKNQDKEYNYTYHHINEVKLNELAYDLMKKAKTDKKFFDGINKRIMKVYDDCKTNEELKFYLKFMNMINDDCKPFFMENPPNRAGLVIPIELHSIKDDNIIFKHIKMLLLLLPQKDKN